LVATKFKGEGGGRGRENHLLNVNNSNKNEDLQGGRNARKKV
jgi:hypothetical protein